MAKVILVNGEAVATLKAAMEITGLKFTAKQVAAGQITGVEFVEVPDEVIPAEVQEEVAQTTAEATEAQDEASEPDKSDEELRDDGMLEENEGTVATEPEATDDTATPEDEEVEYPEKGSFKDEKAIKKYIKKLSNKQLYAWCELEGVTWNRHANEPIDRMRAAMAIKAFHFPALAPKGDTKPKSKYSQYSDEQLIAMAVEKGITVKDAKGDKRINRMYHIIALREAGLLG